MNWVQFIDPVSHMCIAGAVITSWSLIQAVAGSNMLTVITNILVAEFSEINDNILGKVNWDVLDF